MILQHSIHYKRLGSPATASVKWQHTTNVGRWPKSCERHRRVAIYWKNTRPLRWSNKEEHDRRTFAITGRAWVSTSRLWTDCKQTRTKEEARTPACSHRVDVKLKKIKHTQMSKEERETPRRKGRRPTVQTGKGIGTMWPMCWAWWSFARYLGGLDGYSSGVWLEDVLIFSVIPRHISGSTLAPTQHRTVYIMLPHIVPTQHFKCLVLDIPTNHLQCLRTDKSQPVYSFSAAPSLVLVI